MFRFTCTNFSVHWAIFIALEFAIGILRSDCAISRRNSIYNQSSAVGIIIVSNWSYLGCLHNFAIFFGDQWAHYLYSWLPLIRSWYVARFEERTKGWLTNIYTISIYFEFSNFMNLRLNYFNIPHTMTIYNTWPFVPWPPWPFIIVSMSADY